MRTKLEKREQDVDELKDRLKNIDIVTSLKIFVHIYLRYFQEGAELVKVHRCYFICVWLEIFCIEVKCQNLIIQSFVENRFRLLSREFLKHIGFGNEDLIVSF